MKIEKCGSCTSATTPSDRSAISGRPASFAERVGGRLEHVKLEVYDSTDMPFEQYMATHPGTKRMRTPLEWG